MKTHLLCAVSFLLLLSTSSFSQSTFFTTTWKTDNAGSSNSNSITIPTEGTGYNYDVDWDNDGVFDDTGITGDITHSFSSAGTYTINIQGTFPRIFFDNGGDKLKILSVDNWGTIQWTSMENAFYGAENLTSAATDSPDLTNVTSLEGMFRNATSFNGNIGGWNTSTITTMESMFNGASSFNQDISSWNTGAVLSMSQMFRLATAFNQPIGSWNVSGVNTMFQMFFQATSFNADISSWNTMGLTGSSALVGTFSNASAFNQNIGSWNIAMVTNLNSTFNGASSFNQDISGWNTAGVTNMFGMFNNATAFDQDLSAWNVESVTDFRFMFSGVTLSNDNYDALLISWDGQTLSANETFDGGNSQYCSAAAQTARQNIISSDGWTITDGGLCPQIVTPFITTWKTDNAGTSNSTSITIPTSSATGVVYNYDVDWDDDGVYDDLGVTGSITHDFGTAGTYTIRITGDFPRIVFDNGGDRLKILSVDQWGSVQWSSMEGAFHGAENLTVTEADAPNLVNATNMDRVFKGATSINSNLNSWDTSTITSMEEAFSGASSFNGDISFWDTAAVTNMISMFENATSFNVNISPWDTSALSSVHSIFRGATSFNQSIGSWDISSVNDTSNMFNGAVAFNRLIAAWSTSNVTTMQGMFSGASAFNQNIGAWDTSSVTTMEDMFNNATSFDQDLSAWNIENVANLANMFEGVTLSEANYDALLVGWDGQNLTSGASFDGGNSQYCSIAAEDARQNMIDNDGWTIEDGGACTALSIEDLLMSKAISIYPNPVQERLFIDINSSQSIKVQILDITGKQLPLVEQSLNQIDMSSFAKGVYFVKLSTDGSAFYTYKFIKK